MVRKKIDESGNIRYFNEQHQYHREDGPAAIIYGDKAWYINDILHRIDGPAIEYANGSKFYWIMGKEYSYEDWLSIKDYPLLW